MNSNQKFFSVDARTIIQLGRDSIKEFTTALIELVKNSYDADAENVHLEIFSKNGGDYIRIADDGFGMAEQIIDDNWLRIGYSEKKIKKISENNRRKTGEKGIGRIAADRLGKKLIIKTKSKEDVAQGLIVYWDKFDIDNKDINEIPIEVISTPEIQLPNNSLTGTEIIIENLRQDWNLSNIEKLYSELTTLTPPFTDNEKFNIYLKTDIDPKYRNIKVESTFDDAAEVELRVEYNGKQQKLVYYIENRRFPGEEFIKETNLNQLYTKIKEGKNKHLSCGPFTIRLLFFLRDSSVLERSNYSKLTEFRQVLDQNIGIKIYRDGIAVKPYGYMDSQYGDWLGLGERKAQDPAGVGRESYNITPNQLVGGVFIGRDQNIELLDSAAREGLVENEQFEDLKIAVMSAIQILESHRVEVYKKNIIIGKSKASKFESKSAKVDEINKNIDSVENLLFKTKQSDENFSPNFKQSINKLENLLKLVKKGMNVTFDEFLKENRVLNGLATLGITSAVFGHETQSAISLLKQASNNAFENLELTPPNVIKSLSELEKVKKYSKHIGNWGNFALSRVTMEKRISPSTRKVHDILKDCIEEIKPVLDIADINIKILIEDRVLSKVYPLDIEAILFNLITNAYQANLQVNSARFIEVKLFREDRNDIKGYCIQVSDNGPGIASEFINRIWEPLFSTKIGIKKRTPTGTGLGLTIIESIVNELKGYAEAENSKILNGAQFTIWLPKNN